METALLVLLFMTQVTDGENRADDRQATRPPTNETSGQNAVAAGSGLSPTDAERDAAAELIPRGVTIHIDKDFSIKKIAFGMGKGAAKDADLALLKSLPALKSLSFYGQQITEDQLKQLCELQSLTTLSLTMTSASEQAIEALRMALPKCRVHYHALPVSQEPARSPAESRPTLPLPRTTVTLLRELMSRVVRDELALSTEQYEQIRKINERSPGDQRSKINAIAAKLRSAKSDEERIAIRKELSRVWSQTSMDDQLREILNEKQLSRLEQLVMQKQGLQSLADDEVASRLALTSEQRGRIVKLTESLSSRSNHGIPFDAEHYKRIHEVYDVLSDEQKDEWKRMLGPVLPRSPSPLPGRTPKQTAEHWFDNFDRDNDNAVSGAEWQSSNFIRREFLNAGIDLSEPIGREQFVEHYLQIRHPN